MKKGVLIALTAYAFSCTNLSAMEPEKDSSVVLFNKYVDPNHRCIEYADIYKFRDAFKAKYPDDLSIPDLQKRLISCCTLQELGKAAHNYSDDRQTLKTKLLTLFPQKTEHDNEVRSALMFLLPEKSELKDENDYSNYLFQLLQDIKGLENKLTTLNSLLKDKETSIPALQETLDQKNDIEKQKQSNLLAQHQAIKAELEISVPMHQLAHKLLIKRLTDTQNGLESWIESLKQDIEDMKNDPQSQGKLELKAFESRLYKAKQTLAYSKGEGSKLKDWLFGY